MIEAVFCEIELKVGPDLFSQRFVLFVSEESFLKVHGKRRAPFHFVFVFRNEVEMLVMTGVAIRAVVDFVGLERFVQSFRHFIDIGKVAVAFFVAQIDQFADVLIRRYDNASFVALFFENKTLL